MLTVASGVDRVFSLLQKLKFMKFDMGSVLLGAYILVCTRAQERFLSFFMIICITDLWNKENKIIPIDM